MLGVVAHDAGGAEIISSYLRQNKLEFVACLEGPAVSVFHRKFGDLENLPLDDVIAKAQWLLCGTSFPADLEWRAMEAAQQAGKRCVAVLDHWVNYRQRFVRNGEWHFPDRVWVGDAVAEKIARETLPELVIKLVPNAYFIDVQNELAALPKTQLASGIGVRILYVSQPVRRANDASANDTPPCGYTEEEALRYFLSHVDIFGENISKIIIRSHPREAPDAYAWATKEFDRPIIIDNDSTLVEQVSESDIVVGCATMAMVVGLIANKRVISCIPPGGQTTALPYPGLEILENLNKLAQ